MTETDKIIKLITQAAQLNDRLAIRDAIKIKNDDWTDLIQNELGRGFSKRARRRLDPLIATDINILKTVSTETALVYKKPPTRKVVSDGQTESDQRFAEVEKESNINQVMKTVNQYTSFLNHVLIKCVYRKGKIEYDIILPDAFEIFTHEDDWKEIVAIRYYVGNNFTQGIGGNTTATFRHGYVWTKYDCEIDNVVYTGGMVYELSPGMTISEYGVEVNPYKDENGDPLLPFVLTYEEWPVECLLNFTRNSDLVTASIQTAIMMTLIAEMFKFGSFKQMKLTGPLNTEFPGEVAGGYATMWKILSQDGTADIGVIDSEAAIDKFMDFVIRRIQLTLAQRGIPPSAFTLTGTPQSGYAMRLDRQALLDRRQDKVEYYRQFERELFDITRQVNNVHHPVKINENAVFSVDFDDLSFQTTKDEDNRDWSFRISNNVSTPIDVIRDSNPDLSEEDAKMRYEKNKSINSSKSALQPITQGQAK